LFLISGLLALASASAHAAYSSLYTFGDGVCTTTNSPGGAQFYGHRYSNGRVWIEVLAERQGVGYEVNKNWSFFGHYSRNLVTNVSAFAAPGDASSALFIVWVNNADFVDILGDPSITYSSNNIAKWTNAMNFSISNHLTAVQTLYQKGARSFVLPLTVDITKAPFYSLSVNDEAFVRQRIVDYNLSFTNRLRQWQATRPGVSLFTPDLFKLFDGLTQTPGIFGLTNSTGYALESFPTAPLWGAGTNFLFWDYLHPTAKVHEIIADTVQNLIAPPRITSGSAVSGAVTWQLANLPIGLGGMVETGTNFATWTATGSFMSTNATQLVTAPVTASPQFFRLRFPFAWTWP
jgi:outer membrane lipase/esterase